VAAIELDHVLSLPVRIADGSPGISRVILTSEDGEIVIAGDPGDR
jgi:hypothetical protein